MWRLTTMQKRKWEAAKVFGLIVLLPLLTILFVSQVFGQSLPIGQTVRVEATLCDSKEDAESITIAHRDEGYFAATVQYMMLRQTLNIDGEPTCYHARYPLSVVRRVSEFKNLIFPDGTKSVYVLEVKIGEATFFAITPYDAGQGA